MTNHLNRNELADLFGTLTCEEVSDDLYQDYLDYYDTNEVEDDEDWVPPSDRKVDGGEEPGDIDWI